MNIMFFEIFVFKYKDGYDRRTGELKIDNMNSKYTVVFTVVPENNWAININNCTFINLETGNEIKLLDTSAGYIHEEINLNQEYYSHDFEIIPYNNPNRSQIKRATEIYREIKAKEELEKQNKLIRFKGKTIYSPK